MGEALTIEVRDEQGYAIVAAVGEIDISTVTRLRERLFELAVTGRPLVVDLEQVSFLDSSGLAALIGAIGGAVVAPIMSLQFDAGGFFTNAGFIAVALGGMSSLPGGIPVEIEVIVAVR